MDDSRLRKGERTRMMIVERAAHLFGERGYFGASMSDLVTATGIEKGGIYNHFVSKEALALDAFEYSADLLRGRIVSALSDPESAADKLHAFVKMGCEIVTNPPVPGGCPILKSAAESHELLPSLRERVRATMDGFLGTLGSIVDQGITDGEIAPTVNSEELASLLVATMEGGIMLSQLYDDPHHVLTAAAHLHRHLDTVVRAEALRGAD